MRIGILSDIHEDIERLEAAIALLRDQAPDRLVMLGDVFDHGERIADACRILAAAGAQGIWGNHDFGLCTDVVEDLAARMNPGVLSYMASLRPSLTIADCFFQHVEPWLDPTQVEDLWQHFGPPDGVTRIERTLKESPRRVTFMGHLHHWVVASDQGPVVLGSPKQLTLDPARRWFVAVGAVCDGWAATYDTESGLLTPHAVPAPV